MQMKQKLNEERASMAVYVTIVLLSFLIILTGIYMVSASVRKDQLKTIIKIKQSYELDNPYVETIYQNQLSKQNPRYVTRGLLVHYDGINNTGNGHSSTTTTWKDLSGNGNDGILSKSVDTSTFYWGESNITLLGATGTSAMYVDTPINLNDKERTVIYTIDATNLTGVIWGDSDTENLNGTFNDEKFITNRSDTVTNQSKYDYTFTKQGIYQYAVTLSSTELKLYVNGILQGNVNNTDGLVTSNNLRILSAYYTNQNATNIKMYNFMVYDRVLTDSEIQQNCKVDKNKYKF